MFLEVFAEARKHPEEDLFVRALATKVTVKNEAARTPGTEGDKAISHSLNFLKLKTLRRSKENEH